MVYGRQVALSVVVASRYQLRVMPKIVAWELIMSASSLLSTLHDVTAIAWKPESLAVRLAARDF